MLNTNPNTYRITNVKKIYYGKGSSKNLEEIIDKVLSYKQFEKKVVIFIDKFFENNLESLSLKNLSNKLIFFVSTENEPTVEIVDYYVDEIKMYSPNNPDLIVGIGGGSTMDIAKAVSNLLTNGGLAEEYQGWDLVKVPGIYKIGIPTISGTGAESSRTCVLINHKKGIKLGMNSEHTVFNELILDWELTKTVERNQYFYTGMDAYIHCIESLNGRYKNYLANSYSKQVLIYCDEIFNSDDMISEENREKLMIASYLGGCAIGMSYVGLVHPFSAGLSMILGLHHCIANCIVMRAMEEFYPKEFKQFWKFVEKQNIHIPKNICNNLKEEDFLSLYKSTIIHEKPLENALGTKFKEILTFEKVREVFLKM